MDLIQEILLWVENSKKEEPIINLSDPPEQFNDIDPKFLLGQVKLAADNGLLEVGHDMQNNQVSLRLTWRGNDYLEDARSSS